jgi:hypothetical protein
VEACSLITEHRKEIAMADQFDELAKSLAQGISRRQALKVFTAGLAGAVFAALTGKVQADPRTCVTCICGVGRPCNPKSSACTEVRDFPAGQACQQACASQHLRLCGQGNAYHCPHGC